MLLRRPDAMDMVMDPAWLGMVTFHSSREFECGEKTVEDCAYYKERWHFWYVKHLKMKNTREIDLLSIGTSQILFMRCRRWHFS